MSGIEVAGLVLGAFPIMIGCLRIYREEFQRIDAWRDFREQFVSFVEEVEHQQMRYHDNLIRLLDVVVTDSVNLKELIDDPSDPRWENGVLEAPLQRRLGCELDRFMRIIGRMNKDMKDLKSLLQIDGNQISCKVSGKDRSWAWHLQRMRLIFSKKKIKKVNNLNEHNNNLGEILSCSERLVLIAEKRAVSDPVRRLEDMRQHTRRTFAALSRHQGCDNTCPELCASLRVCGDMTLDGVSILVATSNTPSFKQEIVIFRGSEGNSAAASPDFLSNQGSGDLVRIRESVLEQSERHRSLPGLWRALLPTRQPTSGPRSRASSTTTMSARGQRSVRFEDVPTIVVTSDGVGTSSTTVTTPVSSDTASAGSPDTPIPHLCVFLADPEQRQGHLSDDCDMLLKLHKATEQQGASTSAAMLSLREVLDSYHHRRALKLPRQVRFKMAVHIASALLQVHRTPWLEADWSNHHFHFLIGEATTGNMSTKTLIDERPLVTRTFHDGERRVVPLDPFLPRPVEEEEKETISCLRKIGVMILELIFGHSIEDCSFRGVYCGPGGLPNKFTDVATANQWADEVSDDSGPKVADAVRRCLHCAFGPKPRLGDKKFRESVYQDAIEPLINYSATWKDE